MGGSQAAGRRRMSPIGGIRPLRSIGPAGRDHLPYLTSLGTVSLSHGKHCQQVPTDAPA